SYTALRSIEPSATSIELTPAPQLVVALQYRNLLNARTVGSDLSLNWSPTSHWRIDASYSAFRVTPRTDSGSQDAAAASFDADTPGQQWQLRSSTWIGRLELNGSVFHVGRLEHMDVPAYTRVDARAELKLNRQWSVIAAGQNLLQASHAEFV